MIAIHKREKALMKGSLIYLYGENKVLSYGRFTEEEKMIIVVNAGSEDADISLSAWEVGATDQEVMERIVLSDQKGYDLSPKTYKVKHGVMKLSIPANGAMLFKAK